MKMLFYPKGPRNYNKLMQICQYLNVAMTNDPDDNFDIAINWRGAAWHPYWPKLKQIEDSGIKVINARCTNVRKDFVDAAFEDLFGYSSLVDPLTHKGLCVRKSNEQATHDGTIIQCPVPRKNDSFIYQRVINNEVEENTFRDIRIPVFKNHIPIVFFKNKHKSIRFTGSSSVAHVVYPSEFSYFFPDGILGKVVEFCEKIHMEYGEVDLLYDKDEKKYYIIDANKTPGNGIFGQFTPKLRQRVIEILSIAFKEEFLS